MVSLPPRQPVADKQVLDDPADFRFGHHEETAPPTLEIQIALGLGIDVGIEAVELLPMGVRRVHALEILHQKRAVKDAIAEVRLDQCGYNPTNKAAELAHRVAPFLARPVRQGAPLIESGPTRSGTEAASILEPQPPWQFPITTTLSVEG